MDEIDVPAAFVRQLEECEGAVRVQPDRVVQGVVEDHGGGYGEDGVHLFQQLLPLTRIYSQVGEGDVPAHGHHLLPRPGDALWIGGTAGGERLPLQDLLLKPFTGAHDLTVGPRPGAQEGVDLPDLRQISQHLDDQCQPQKPGTARDQKATVLVVFVNHYDSIVKVPVTISYTPSCTRLDPGSQGVCIQGMDAPLSQSPR